MNFYRQIIEGFSNVMKIPVAGAELFRADGRTDVTNLTVAFRSFANGPNKIVTNQ